MTADGLEPVEVTGSASTDTAGNSLGRTRSSPHPERLTVSRKSDSRRLLHRRGGRYSTRTIVVVFVEMRV